MVLILCVMKGKKITGSVHHLPFFSSLQQSMLVAETCCVGGFQMLGRVKENLKGADYRDVLSK